MFGIMKTMEVRLLQPADVPSIASLHTGSLTGFLSSLGAIFLGKFYAVAFFQQDIFTFVAVEQKNIVGFVTCAQKINGLLRRVIFYNPLWFIFFFLKYFLRHPFQIIPAIQTLMYPGFLGDEPELLSFAVEKNQRGKGIGKKLFFACAEEFRRRGYTSFLISAYDRLPANGFYEKMGCRLIRSFEFHGEKMNYYRYRIQVKHQTVRTH